MTVAIQSPVTGAAITGLTSPTYTLVADTPPEANAKCYVVSALGGTQTNVRTHTLSDPFQITAWKPKVLKLVPPQATNLNGLALGKPLNVPMNSYAFILRKGVYCDPNQLVPRVANIKVSFDIPAGSDANDTVQLKAALSCLIGAIWADVQDFSDLVTTGVM